MIIKRLAFNKTNKTRNYYYEPTSAYSKKTKNYYENLCLIKKSSLTLGRY